MFVWFKHLIPPWFFRCTSKLGQKFSISLKVQEIENYKKKFKNIIVIFEFEIEITIV